MLRSLKAALAAGALLVSGSASAVDTSLPHVAFLTNMGVIVLELEAVRAPVSVANFLGYIRDKTYDNSIFYRVVPGFVVQGGAYGADGQYRPVKPGIALEANNGLKNVRGALSMARNDEPNTGQAEFFIVLRDTPGLDPKADDTENKTGYAVFGHVVQGMDVVDNISRLQLGGTGPFGAAAPLKPVVINKVLVLPKTNPK